MSQIVRILFIVCFVIGCFNPIIAKDKFLQAKGKQELINFVSNIIGTIGNGVKDVFNDMANGWSLENGQGDPGIGMPPNNEYEDDDGLMAFNVIDSIGNTIQNGVKDTWHDMVNGYSLENGQGDMGIGMPPNGEYEDDDGLMAFNIVGSIGNTIENGVKDTWHDMVNGYSLENGQGDAGIGEDPNNFNDIGDDDH